MFDEQGKNTWSMELDIYGQVRALQGRKEDCPFRYPGQYEDSETGLYYNRFRYYDPEVGGYVSQDPIGLMGDNPTIYGYVDDPLDSVDFYGLACKKLPKSHRAFKRGASVLIPENMFNELKKRGITQLGKDSLFVITRGAANRLSKRSLKTIQRKIGIPGTWSGKILRFDIPSSKMKNLRLPTGAEAGANKLFKKGGRTSGGELEAIIEPVPFSDLIQR